MDNWTLGAWNGTTEGPHTFRTTPNAYDYGTIAILSAIFAAGAPVNLALAFRLSERFSSLTNSQRLKLQLILADLMVLFIYAVSKICWHITWAWRGGLFLCKVLKFSHELSFQFSSAILALIGLDRSLLILRPFAQPEAMRRRVGRGIRLAWAYACLCSLPNLYWWTIFTIPNSGGVQQCVNKMHVWKLDGVAGYAENEMAAVTHTFHLLTVFWVPLVAIVISYSHMAAFVWRHYMGTPGSLSAQLRSDGSSSSERRGADGLLCGSDCDRRVSPRATVSFNVATEQVELTKEERDARLSLSGASSGTPAAAVGRRDRAVPMRMLTVTLLLITSYVLCWLPYHLTVLFAYFKPDYYLANKSTMRLLNLLTLLNSVLNPFIYGLTGHGLCRRKPQGILKNGATNLHQRLVDAK